MIYLDTSVLVAAITGEPRTADATEWIRENARSGLATSDWVTTEVSAALSMKLRGGSVTLEERGMALADFAQLRQSLLTSRPILPGFFEAAARLADRHDTKLRSGDALHLAICLHYRDSLCTLDKIMANAGLMLGLSSHLLEQSTAK